MSEKLKLVPTEPTDAMLDRAVAFALNVSIGGKYGWTEYMRDLWVTMLAGAPSDVAQAPSGYCVEGENHCVCGGDLPRVREGCGNWRKVSAPAVATLTDEVLHNLYRTAFSCQHDYNEFKREARAILATHPTK